MTLKTIANPAENAKQLKAEKINKIKTAKHGY